MSISRDEVIFLYKAILGRLPESEKVTTWAMDFYADFMTARKALLQSNEFRSSFAQAMYYIPEPSATVEKKQGVSLALATIVKDEEACIEKMIQSCVPIIDFAVIVDTGSTDNTQQVAISVLKQARIPYDIINIKFENFAKARNVALSRIPSRISWTLMLDADEQLVSDDYQKWLDLLNAQTEVWEVPRFNFTDASKAHPVHLYPDFQRRLLRNRTHGRPIRYYKAVHEEVEPPYEHQTAPVSQKNIGGPSGGPHIHHFGHVNLDEERARKKSALYESLADSK